MSTSGQSPPADHRNLTSRVAPRRHREAAGQSVTSQTEASQSQTYQEATCSYDSSDFPVLLRMPDVSPPPRRMESAPIASIATERFRDPAMEASVPMAAEPRLSRFTWNEEGDKKRSETDRDRRTTGSAAARFWSSIPPQVASGGMLLAVIGMCLVLMRGNSTPQPAVNPHSEWTESEKPQNKDEVADVPVTPVPLAPSPKTSEWNPERPSVAAKPTIEFPEPTPAKRPQATTPDAVPIGWPDLPSTQNSAAPSQGWPDDLQQSHQEQETILNSPLGSTQRQSMPGARTAQRDTRPALPNSSSMPRMSDAPYLNGTVEIPPATQIYR